MTNDFEDTRPAGEAKVAEELLKEETQMDDLSGESDVDVAAFAAPPPSPMQDTARDEEINALKEQLLRLHAETDNIRRRTHEELVKTRKYAVEAFAENLLPVIDSLYAALAVESATAEQMREGVKATLAQFASVLERQKIEEIFPPAGEVFDPHRHQAVSMVAPVGNQAPNTIATVLQRGYLLAGRVLRPAIVTVIQP